MNIHYSVPISKSQCPKCASNGQDTRKDNLHLYDDGHAYCFACGFYKGNKKAKPPRASHHIPKATHNFSIPDDAGTDIPFRVMQWLSGICHFTQSNIIHNKILWSEKYKWLIFPIEHEGEALGFQARNFNIDKPYKWYTKFHKKDLLKLYLPVKSGKLENIVLVEDIISAIRVSKHLPCAPLFGSIISDKLLLKIKKICPRITIWLDSDKTKEALVYAQRARELNLECHVLLTKLDPKCYPDTKLKEILKEP